MFDPLLQPSTIIETYTKSGTHLGSVCRTENGKVLWEEGPDPARDSHFLWNLPAYPWIQKGDTLINSIDYSNAKIPGPSGLSGGLSDYSTIPTASEYSLGFQQTAGRSSIPEDSARRLFDTLYDALVFASSEDRRKAVLMLVAAYDLLV